MIDLTDLWERGLVQTGILLTAVLAAVVAALKADLWISLP
jgi:hypothetical protein